LISLLDHICLNIACYSYTYVYSLFSGVNVQDALKENSIAITEESLFQLKYDPQSVWGYIEVYYPTLVSWNSILTSQFNFGHAAQNSNFSVFSILSLRFLMLQVHIEQGPVLEWVGFPLGVVKGIAGQTRLKVHSVFTFQNKYKIFLSILFT